MSLSAISGLDGILSAPVDPTFATSQVASKSQTANQPVVGSGSVQPILMVPTKPPLSPAVMAELIGRQVPPFGSPVEDVPNDQSAGAADPKIPPLLSQ